MAEAFPADEFPHLRAAMPYALEFGDRGFEFGIRALARGLLSCAARGLRILAVPLMRYGVLPPYSIFGIGVDRKHVLKWLFSKEKATLHAL
jgi:hypothetical protein